MSEKEEQLLARLEVLASLSGYLIAIAWSAVLVIMLVGMLAWISSYYGAGSIIRMFECVLEVVSLHFI